MSAHEKGEEGKYRNPVFGSEDRGCDKKNTFLESLLRATTIKSVARSLCPVFSTEGGEGWREADSACLIELEETGF